MSVIFGEFPGGPVVKDSTLPLQGAWVPSLVGELEPHKPHSYTHTHIHTHTHTRKLYLSCPFGKQKEYKLWKLNPSLTLQPGIQSNHGGK